MLTGDIPFSISKLKQLELVILKSNQLIGPIPSTLSQIPNLKILDLAQNQLNGEIPRLIYWNEVFQYLIEEQQFGRRAFARYVSVKLTGLWYFDVRNNSLSGTIPSDIGNCTGFQVLYLSYNRLTGVIPFNIGFLQVATLSLQGNQLSGEIPSVIGLMQGKKGVWLKLSLELVNLVKPAVKEGFWYHHAEPTYVMLMYWIPETSHTLPPNASHRVGVASFVVNSNAEVLVVQEKSRAFNGSGVWKLPTGTVEEGEDISTAAIREVKEEAGIDTEFMEVLAFRQSHKSFFSKSDMMFVCMLKPTSFDIQKQDSEIEAAQIERLNVII